jgi:hypothetical protein
MEIYPPPTQLKAMKILTETTPIRRTHTQSKKGPNNQKKVPLPARIKLIQQ